MAVPSSRFTLLALFRESSIGKPVENPARPRHCNRGGLATMPLTDEVGKAASPMKRESGDLPEVGWV